MTLKMLLTAAVIATLLSTVAIMGQKQMMVANATLGLLRIHHPKGGETVAAGSTIAVDGTSAPSNSTHRNCVVNMIFNGGNASKTTPGLFTRIGPDYQTWKTTVGPVVQGSNSIEGELKCFGMNGQPNLVKHLVHNVTGIGAPIGNSGGSKGIINLTNSG